MINHQSYRDLTVAGTAVQYLYEGEKLPLVIAKDPKRRGPDMKGSYRFGVCFDGSEPSKRCLKTVLSMMADHDTLVVITCYEEHVDMANTKEAIRKICEPRRYQTV